MNEKMSLLRKKAMALPLQSGVYIMKNKKKEIVYIGKAKKLKNRVSQYFGSQNNHSPKVRCMVESVDDFDYIITDSEFEALILECSLIKQHKPKYNILLKDDKGYSYIKVSGDKWQRISCALQKDDEDARYIGPYNSSFVVKQAVQEANSVFMLPDCNRRFPEDFGKARPCLNFHIKKCCAPCTGKVKFADYKKRVDYALDFLSGGSSESLKKLTAEMEQAAENLEFERAAALRDSINAIKKLSDKQKVIRSDVKNQDVIAYAKNNDKACFAVFRFEGGRLCDKLDFVVDILDDDKEAREEFIISFYSSGRSLPEAVTLDEEIENAELLEKWLSEKRGKRVYINVPKIGQQRSLVLMCRDNAAEKLAQLSGFTGKELSVLQELRDLLSMDRLPAYIESYDISNQSGAENVAGMVVFENGKPLKKAYKKFKIKSFEGQDDYSSMREVLERRFEEYLLHKDEGEGFGRLPDLILLDGGKGQVSAVKDIVEKYAPDVYLFGMVKDGNHRTRAITTDNREITINNNRRLFTFISSVQDEVHRFAIGFHRKRRSSAMLKSSLTDIEGIGQERGKLLLKHFGSIKNISHADIDELLLVPRMTKPAALAVYRHFHPNDEEE
ncbi:MAG: excinuclease ABC subunit UvrC [Ruminococcaceae bacterium]|nr:excinuclease ABC subunit UvrC [Oscillospiraceae bacterium]